MKTRWVGIDEAGYGPRLGPLTMAAVVAESTREGETRPDLWNDLESKVTRAGGRNREEKLWVDDSKRIFSNGRGMDRLEAATHALIQCVSEGSSPTKGLSSLLAAFGAGDFKKIELHGWLLDDQADPPSPTEASADRVERALIANPLSGAADWRIVAARATVVGPHRFNQALDESPARLKSDVHFSLYAELLRWAWETTEYNEFIYVNSDKHGGRHFYGAALAGAFPEVWIERREEGPHASRYLLKGDGRRLEVIFRPKADRDDGLTALASIAAKTLREYWMGVFNAFWRARRPRLRPTAGYPGDAERFRAEIVEECRALGLDERQWWREK